MFGAEEQVPGHDDRYFVADGDPCSFTLRYSERFQQDCGLFAAPSLSQVTPQPRQHGSDEQMFGAKSTRPARGPKRTGAFDAGVKSPAPQRTQNPDESRSDLISLRQRITGIADTYESQPGTPTLRPGWHLGGRSYCAVSLPNILTYGEALMALAATNK